MQAKLLRVLQTGHVRAGRRDRDDQGRRPDRRRQQQAARGRGQGGPVPRRPVLPAQRDPDRPAPAARADRGHPAPGDALPREARSPMSTPPVTEIDSEAMQALLRPHLAGQRPRAGERDQGGRGDGRRARSSTATPCPRSSRPRPRSRSGGSSLIDIDRPLPDLTGDLIGQVERDYFTRLLVAVQGERRPLRQAQRPLAAERHPEAPEVRPRPHPVQARRGERGPRAVRRVVIGATAAPARGLELRRSPASRQRDVLELELQRDRDHLARGLVDELVVGGLAGGVDEEVLEAELAAVGAGVGEAAVVLEPRAVGLLEPEPVVEQPLAIALERRALARDRRARR